MTNDRIIQASALAILLVTAGVCGNLLPRITETTERHVLRYTDVAVEGAPPVVALGTAIGALRGLIVDYLWIKVNLMKQKGLYYEVMADADLITKLQPRFAAVWAFHGHNMAYNISVAHNTESERWEWVKAGINLVRNRGLRYNPNDLQLHRELAFWFSHKIEGVADDAHLYYKREFAREWHSLLGMPPHEWDQRIAWMKKVADAPDTIEAAERRSPGVRALIERLQRDLSPFEQRLRFDLDINLLKAYSEWMALQGQSRYAQAFQLKEKMVRDDPSFRVFDEIASDPALRGAWDTLLPHIRKRVLLDDYNMDPKLMYEYTRDYGPIDWRHAQAHALYWSLKGTEHGEDRVAVSEDDVYRIVNNDRIKLQAMQGLARWGRISFDPYSIDWVSRFPDPRWIEVIDRYWEKWSIKHKTTRGTGVDMFMAFHQNFLSSAIRELYRSGETALAQKYLDRLDDLYGMGHPAHPDPKYAQPLETFVWNETRGEYEFQPHMAPSDVAASLRYAFRVGIGQNRPKVFEEAVAFSNQVTEFFKTNNYNYFVTKMGSARLGDLVAQLKDSVVTVFAQLMVDSTIRLDERLVIWLRASDDLKLQVYDDIYPLIFAQLQVHPLWGQLPIEKTFAEPPGMEAFRRLKAIEQQRQKEQRDEIERR